MSYRLFADAVVVLHFAIVVFVVCGGLLVVRWRKVAWVHLPIVAWVIFAEWFHRICPLTFLENWLRDRGGAMTYRGDFVDHYIMPVLYPSGLTDTMQVTLGTLILVINATLYGIALYRRRPAGAYAEPAPHPPPAHS